MRYALVAITIRLLTLENAWAQESDRDVSNLNVTIQIVQPIMLCAVFSNLAPSQQEVERVFHLGLEAEAFKTKTRELEQAGYSLTCLSGAVKDPDSEVPCFSGIWEKRTNPNELQWLTEISPDQISETVKRENAAGNRLTRMQMYGRGFLRRCILAFEKGVDRETKYSMDLNHSSASREIARMRNSDLQPAWASTHVGANGEVLYNIIWSPKTENERHLAFLDDAENLKNLDQRIDGSCKPVCFDWVVVDRDLRSVLIWETRPEGTMQISVKPYHTHLKSSEKDIRKLVQDQEETHGRNLFRLNTRYLFFH